MIAGPVLNLLCFVAGGWLPGVRLLHAQRVCCSPCRLHPLPSTPLPLPSTPLRASASPTPPPPTHPTLCLFSSRPPPTTLLTLPLPAGMAASVMLADAVYDVSCNVILDSAMRAISAWDIVTSMIKCWVFGTIISTGGCWGGWCVC